MSGAGVSDVVRPVLERLLGSRADWRLQRPARPGRPHPGLAWVGPSVLIGATATGWFAFADAVGREDDVSFALFIGSVSVLLMAWSNILATRLPVLEPFFGGLDSMYRWHRWFGALSVAAMWLHVQQVDDVKGIAGASKNVADAAEELAGLGEKFLYVLALASFVRWVPYRWWRQSHRFLIVAFVTASWHFHTATKPYANDSLWGRWFQFVMLLGLAAWVYRVVWRDGLRRGRPHRVVSVLTEGATTTVDMEPVGRSMDWRPGQFVFVRIGSGALAEPHPFTVASHPRDGVVRIMVRDLGDWSGRLAGRVSVGDTVMIEGPYGALRLRPRRRGTVVWIAGGVGITPFLGGSRMRRVDEVPHLFYAVSSRQDAPGLAELAEAHGAGRIVLHLHVSEEGSRLRVADLEDAFGRAGLAGAHVVMCGPATLVRDMTEGARSLGASRVHVEKFDIRTGIGPDLSAEVDDVVKSLRHRRRSARSAAR